MFEASTLSADEIVRLSKQHTLFEWSAQAALAPIPMAIKSVEPREALSPPDRDSSSCLTA